MSLTVIGVMMLLVGLILAVGSFFLGLDTENIFIQILSVLFFSVAVVGLVITVSSYNENARETTERNKIECVENGGMVVKVARSEACMSSGSEWRGWIG